MSLAREITSRLKGDWCGSYGTVPAPGHSARDRSVSVRAHPTDADDVVINSFTGERWEDIKDEWRRDGILPAKDFRTARPPDPAAAAITKARKMEAEKEAAATAADRLRVAIDLWDRGEPVEGTVVETYLRWRGIELRQPPATLRYLAPNPPKYPFPAMLAVFGMATEPEPGRCAVRYNRIKGVHITALAPDGQGKAPVEKERKMIGHSSGWPIVLAPPNDGLALVIAEGVETALTVHQASGMGAWAAGTAGRMPALADRVPSYIEAITIAAEDDDASRQYVPDLAQRLNARGFEVSIAEAAYGA